MNAVLEKPLPILLVRAFSILVGAAALLCGMQAFRRDAAVFAGPPRAFLSPPFRIQLQKVVQRLPPGEPVFHLSAAPEYWYSRLWQRALYPRNDSIVIQPPLGGDRLRHLRSKYGVRFAISVGDPPVDPGYLWKIDLGPLPGVPGESSFGELAP